MRSRLQPTESGFIVEGEVLDGSLLEALKGYEGRRVRITLEVVEPRPVDALREVLERFRLDAEAPEEAQRTG